MSRRRTLWEEGRKPGRLVVTSSLVLVLASLVLNLLLVGRISLFFDLVFVVVCVGAALWVRPSDFFVVGVLPPLLMAGALLVVGAVARASVADRADGLLQALVSGLAHHAGALVAGYGLTLTLLALRQVALRNSGTIRQGQRRDAAPRRRSSHVMS